MRNLILSLGIVFLLGFGVIVPTKEAHSLTAAECIDLISLSGGVALENRCDTTINLMYCVGYNCSPARQRTHLRLRSGDHSFIVRGESSRRIYAHWQACIHPSEPFIRSDGLVRCTD